jgi:hypothetical protein
MYISYLTSLVEKNSKQFEESLILVYSIWSCIKYSQMDPGSHVGFQISTKNTNLVEDHPVNISGKFG